MSSAIDFADRANAVFAQTVADLKDLVKIPSISAVPANREQMSEAAQRIVDLLKEANCPDVRLVEADGLPAIIARYPAPEGAPTVCLYAHYDVQPAAAEQGEWSSPAFEPTQRGDRLYGRGAADDKAGFAAHLGTLRVFDGKPPVGVTLFIEGEEEIGSPSLGRIIEQNHDLLKADLYVIADSLNWQAGQPAFTTTLRGIADCVVELETLTHPLHSGNFGGVAPDALTMLVKLLATLVDDEGACAIEGLVSAPDPQIDYTTELFQKNAQLLDGVQLAGSGSVAARLWTRPAVSVLAIDSTSVAEASNTLAAKASAKVSLRVAPGDDADRALEALVAHLKKHTPLGAKLTISEGSTGQPGIIDMDSPIVDLAMEAWGKAWGKQPVIMGCGGSIPMAFDFQQAFPGAQILMTAVADQDSRMHGVDESVFLPDVLATIEAQSRLLASLAPAK